MEGGEEGEVVVVVSIVRHNLGMVLRGFVCTM